MSLHIKDHIAVYTGDDSVKNQGLILFNVCVSYDMSGRFCFSHVIWDLTNGVDIALCELQRWEIP